MSAILSIAVNVRIQQCCFQKNVSSLSRKGLPVGWLASTLLQSRLLSKRSKSRLSSILESPSRLAAPFQVRWETHSSFIRLCLNLLQLFSQLRLPSFFWHVKLFFGRWPPVIVNWITVFVKPCSTHTEGVTGFSAGF